MDKQIGIALTESLSPYETMRALKDRMGVTPLDGGGKDASKWAPTSRKVQLPDGTRRTLYAARSRPGETRIRRMVLRPGAAHAKATYVKPPAGARAVTTKNARGRKA